MTHELERGTLYFELLSGRKVRVEQVHVQLSTLGVLEGRFDVIRRECVARVPARAAELFGKNTPACVVPPPDDVLPTYLVFVSLSSFEPVKDGDFSYLVIAWFVENLPKDLPLNISRRLNLFNWDDHAADGGY